eukprot:CAMPEP_0197847254 /NCGR_PEP_ID=MMETSP1438-20131217/5671_1 /TAXON_ID=1461541 /ORGANISM="Pterosperma sp., Strain CCMP1384" /LENGTH=128 /DNA_ID=CAMNT_0043459125 /DNA_START=32 /DNA_END=418 /DNA_ORIENTATION=-
MTMIKILRVVKKINRIWYVFQVIGMSMSISNELSYDNMTFMTSQTSTGNFLHSVNAIVTLTLSRREHSSSLVAAPSGSYVGIIHPLEPTQIAQADIALFLQGLPLLSNILSQPFMGSIRLQDVLLFKL